MRKLRLLSVGLLPLAALAATNVSCDGKSLDDGTFQAFDPDSFDTTCGAQKALELSSHAQGAKDAVPRSLFIQPEDIATLELDGPGKPAHISTLLLEMVGGDLEAYHDLVESWLKAWKDGGEQTVVVVEEGREVVKSAQLAPRTLDALIDAWKENGKFVPERAPLKLVSVVNRVDLWNPPPEALTSGNAKESPQDSDNGETRFVYALDLDGFRKMTVIFEYRNPLAVNGQKRTITDWANQWLAVATDTGYNKANVVQLIADVTGRGVVFNPQNAIAKGSMHRGQIRTNEFLIGDSNGREPWNLREFKLRDIGGKRTIVHTNVKQAFHVKPGNSLAAGEKTLDFLMKSTGDHFNFELAADGQVIDGFLSAADGVVFETDSDFGGPGPRLSTRDQDAILNLLADKDDAYFECFVERGGLPSALRQSIKTSVERQCITDESQKLRARFAMSVEKGIEMANCSGCHHTMRSQGVPTVDLFLHVSATGELSSFVKSALVPEREEFMKAALCPKEGTITYRPAASGCTTRGGMTK